jgi:serine/threonine protein phosphatase 1
MEFTPGVEHRHVDGDDWDDVYVVGDVHGCLRELQRLVSTLGVTADDLVVLVGDLVRKGPDAEGVVEFVSERPNVMSVRGNNEQKVLDGSATTDADEERLAALPVAVTLDDALVVHGGVDPRKPIAEHTTDELVTMRSIPRGNGYDGPFWFESYDGPPRIFVGHTVLADPYVGEWAVALDTGCVYGGELTAYDYRRDELTSVPAERTYASGPSSFREPPG